MDFFLLLVVGVTGVLALAFAFVSYGRITRFTVENERVAELSEIIHRGAMAFLYREYKWLLPFLIIVGVILWFTIGRAAGVSSP